MSLMALWIFAVYLSYPLYSYGFAPKYQTAYACEGKKLTIECDPGDLINLIRANYGRFSITICNDHGNVEWSVNCMFPKSLTVLNSRCSHKQSCSVLATTNMFGDPCPGTHKYLEAHYQCISAAQTSTTTNRPSPPWVLANNPPLLANGSTLINPAAAAAAGAPNIPPSLQPSASSPRLPPPAPDAIGGGGGGIGGPPTAWNTQLTTSAGPPTLHTTLPGGRLKGGPYSNATIANKNVNRHDGLPPPPPLHHHHHNGHHGGNNANDAATVKTSASANTTTPPNTRILTGIGGAGSDDGTLLTTKSALNRGQLANGAVGGTTATTATTQGGGNGTTASGNGGNFSNIIRTINNINNLNAGLASDEDDANMFCGPTNARNLFWNITRVGDVNVQPCPGGATGIAKWRCVLMKRYIDTPLDDDASNNGVAPTTTTTTMATKLNGAGCNSNSNLSICEPTILANKMNQRIRNFEPTWHPITPDLTQCRSLWLNNLEVRVNQRDSSLISIANDLSEVTSSKTLYGGDMLVTTKIIQTMSEKMYHDKETFPDQRQREAIILELLHGVVKTGSNLLDESQLSSWLDLNQEDQMRVATSLLTGLEYNAFLLADTIIRERNVVQKVKNILLSVRVLETKNIPTNEVFPDAEQWQISDDRIELPRAALLENSEGGLVRIVFAAFDRLESILKPSYDHFDLKSSRSYVRNTALLTNETSDASNSGQQQQQQRIRILNSKVISASLGKGRHIQLSQPIKLVLRHIKIENVTNPTCVFWNYIDHAWSANGCNLESTNRTHSICMCNHLTNFAILMDVMDEHTHSLFTMFDGNMRVLIYISISICLVFIVIALLTLKIFNGVFVKSARTSIYRNIYICLLFVEILFLFGIEQNESSVLCGFTTVFLHCSILSAIAWFCFEAFQSYTTLTTDDMLLEVDQTSKVNCYYLLSYGLALTIVAISLAINPSAYTQNDFCVLMETNILFYVTFVTPVFLFILAALVYTFLSWVIMCRKNRTTLKNKEHTRLSNVRFDIRCSFIFLLLLSVVWISAYFYLRRAKADDEVAIVLGYLFVGFNTLMGLYIFVFHCIQNEKIRREYRKYVRQNSWLPKCLRCSKASISSGIVGGSGGSGGIGVGSTIGNTGGGGTTSSNNTIINHTSLGNQMKKSKITIGDINDDVNGGGVADGVICSADDAIMASSDCELNEAQIRRAAGGNNGGGGTLKSGIMPGNLILQHGKANSIIDSMQGHIVLERAAGASGTLRSTGGSAGAAAAGGMHTPSAGHTSPTSSVSSTHLIFGHGHKQQASAGGVGNGNNGGGKVPQQEAYYHHPEYYSWKQSSAGGKGVPHPRDYHDNSASSMQQPHEFFYWTQKNNQHGKKKRGSAVGLDSPSGSLHSRTTAASQVLFYPSYKKTTLKNPQQQQSQYQQQPQYHHYAEAMEPSSYYQKQHQHQQQQQHRRQISAAPHHAHMQQHYLQQQQQQLSSDDEQMESAANAHLLHLSRRGVGGGGGVSANNGSLHHHPSAYPHHQQQQQQHLHHQYQEPADVGGMPQQQRYYRNKHSNCDLNRDYDMERVSDSYYNQDSLGGDCPVYEEILSNRNSDVQHYDVGDLDGVGDGAVAGGGVVDGVSSHRRHRRRRRRFRHRENDNDDDYDDEESVGNDNDKVAVDHDHDDNADDDDDDNDDDDDDDDEDEHLNGGSGAAHCLPAQSDERMRRLMAMQDEDFQRRFQRQQRKNAIDTARSADYHDISDTPSQWHQHQQQTNGIFASGGATNAGTSSGRNFKKLSPNSRLAVNEFFQHGPPALPPANQYPMQKRQQPSAVHAQQLSPQSATSVASSIANHTLQQQKQLQQQQQQAQPQQQQQQQPVGRNISAMLDEDNTVRCYLEPLTK